MYSIVLCKKLMFSAVVRDLSRSLNIAIFTLNKNTHGTSCTNLFSHNATAHLDRLSFLQPNTYAASSTVCRYYCKEYRPFPEVPEFPPIIWPNLFKSIKALLYSLLIIKPQFDKDFSLGDFAKNSKKAVGVVSNCIAKRDFSTLQGLVTNDVLEQVKSIVSNLSDKEIKDMAFSDEDIYLFLPCQLDVVNDAKLKNRQFVEITMCYHAIHDLEEVKKKSEEIEHIQKELKSSIYVLNYRFIREYTQGVNDAWTVNAINHLKAEEHDKTIL